MLSFLDLYVNVSFFSMAPFWPSCRTLVVWESGLAFVWISVNGVLKRVSSSRGCAQRVDFFTLWHTGARINVSPSSCSGVEYSKQVFGGSYFNLQVGQLPVLTGQFCVPQWHPCLPLPPGCRGCFQGNVFLSLMELLCKGRRKTRSSIDKTPKRHEHNEFLQFFVSLRYHQHRGEGEYQWRHFPGSMHSRLFLSRRMPVERGMIMLQMLISAMWQYGAWSCVCTGGTKLCLLANLSPKKPSLKKCAKSYGVVI